MKKEIKRKFIDILFENDDDTKETESEGKKSEPVENAKAKAVLYQKPEKSAFIDVDEKPAKKKEEQKEKNNEYEFSSQISPIFGVIKESEHNNNERVINTNENLINKPENTHLDIITSPIYGYGTKEDDEDVFADNKTDVQEEIIEKEDVQYSVDEDDSDELDYLFDYDEDKQDDYPADDEYNLFNTSKEDE